MPHQFDTEEMQMTTTTFVQDVGVHRPRADDVTRATFTTSRNRPQAYLAIGAVTITVGGDFASADELRAQAYAMQKIAMEAEALAEWLTVLAESDASNHDERAAVGA